MGLGVQKSLLMDSRRIIPGFPPMIGMIGAAGWLKERPARSPSKSATGAAAFGAVAAEEEDAEEDGGAAGPEAALGAGATEGCCTASDVEEISPKSMSVDAVVALAGVAVPNKDDLGAEGGTVTLPTPFCLISS